jgi:hypothetical protein
MAQMNKTKRMIAVTGLPAGLALAGASAFAQTNAPAAPTNQGGAMMDHSRAQMRRRLCCSPLFAAFGHALDIAAGTKGSAGASQHDRFCQRLRQLAIPVVMGYAPGCFRGMKRDAVPGMSINGRQASV